MKNMLNLINEVELTLVLGLLCDFFCIMGCIRLIVGFRACRPVCLIGIIKCKKAVCQKVATLLNTDVWRKKNFVGTKISL